MRRVNTQITGLILLVLVFLLQVTGNPLAKLMHKPLDPNRYWVEDIQLTDTIEGWKGQAFDFKSWVYYYIPKPYIDGWHYQDPQYPSRYVEVSLVHSTVKDHLHDPNLCSYSQGFELKLLKQVTIPGTNIGAAFRKLTLSNSKEEYYQLNWYQWGPQETAPNYTAWLPVALGWGLFHSESPRWHYFSVVYVDNQQPLTEEEALAGLLRFSEALQKGFKTPKMSSS